MKQLRPISLVILTTRHSVNRGLIDELSQKHRIKGIVFEDQKRLRARLFIRRLRARGLLEVLDQILFKILELLILSSRTGRKVEGACSSCESFQRTRFGETEVLETRSVNSQEVLSLIPRTKPDMVVVSGTSILDGNLLSALGSIPVINIHCGITPRYRGAHGGFWAIVNDDWDNVGTTVHFIDSGIDTGNIIAQRNIEVEPNDTPQDLASKQHTMGAILAVKAIASIAGGHLQTVNREDLDSRFYSSPTLTAYLRYRKNLRKRFSSMESGKSSPG